jgi:hypothetical protein
MWACQKQATHRCDPTNPMSAAFVSFLEYNRVDKSLKQYNQSILSLKDIRNWWLALEDEQADQIYLGE